MYSGPYRTENILNLYRCVVDMNNRTLNDSGTYTDKLTEQDVLKAFDYETTAEAPMLTASEITDAVAEHFVTGVSSETVHGRLREMEDSELVASKEFGASAAGWTPLVGPRLSDDVQPTRLFGGRTPITWRDSEMTVVVTESNRGKLKCQYKLHRT